MPANPIVCCVKWGAKYPPLYVDRLRNMVARHLERPHDFVCLTDDRAGLEPGIATLALPDIFPGFWNKISLFRRGMFEPGQTILYLDLDIVIVGSLDFVFEDPGGFRFIGTFGTRPAFNSSVMRMQGDEQAHVYDRFVSQAVEVINSGRYAGDQNWITEQIPDTKFFPVDKILSYKRSMPSHAFPLAKKLKLDFNWLRAPRYMTVAPPPGASIVVFHGKPDPEDVMDAPYGPWKRAPFVKEHWR